MPTLVNSSGDEYEVPDTLDGERSGEALIKSTDGAWRWKSKRSSSTSTSGQTATATSEKGKS